MQTTKLLWIPLVATALLAGCSRSAPSGDVANKRDAASNTNTPAMPSMPQAAQRAEHMAEGTLNSIEQAGGRVNITHGPVASANWPGMTMSFKLADAAAASDLKPGQRVQFHFTIESGMDATVTQIRSID
jgi:Cu(I)/Ag(I) efflux system membrane fusion protein